ncbi:MAG TPA: PQQ-binding-like beta-propeller repeat protein [Treponemataceae bacterium]|nr:PQQ-binding-like beta-propeller repeat protein [Treponemataceae bacterium]
MKRNNAYRCIVVVCAIAFLFAGCGAKKASDAADAQPSIQGTVTFVCGPVQLIQGTATGALDIGMSVPVDATIATGSDATCEIQFAEYGSVHLSPNTKLSVSRLFRDATHTEAEMKLSVGAVVCKVRKLSGNDRFNVRTSEMVAGVRGTVFLVSTDGTTSSKVAVSEGAVAVSPVSTVTAVAEAVGASADSSARGKTLDVSEKIVSAMPCLAKGEEVTVTRASAEEADRLVREIYADAAGSTDAISQATLEKIASAGTAMKNAGVSGKPIAPETQSFFDSAAYLEIRDLKLPAASDSGSSKEKDGAAADVDAKRLVSLTVSVDPADATVSVNGATLSKGAFRGLFGQDETIELAVTKEGFKDYRETVALSSGDAVTRAVKLEAGEKQSSGALSVQPVPVSSVKIIALSADGGSVIAASDAAGKVYALGPDGKVRWSQSTGNGSNGNSPAVIGNGAVAYAGDSVLAVFDAATGAKLWQKSLGKGDSGLFGRKPAFAGSALAMSSDGGIVAFDAKTGAETARFAMTDGSDMSPASSGGVLYIASKSGAFHAIDAATMTEKSSVQTGAVQPVASAPAISGNLAIVADRRGLVTAVSLPSMTVAWQKRLDPVKSVEVFSDPVLTGDSAFVMGKGALYALSLADGSPRFAAIQGITSQPCLAKGYVWCGAGTALLQIVPSTGAVAGKLPLPAVASGKPAFDGVRLFVPLTNGSVGIVSLDALK